MDKNADGRAQQDASGRQLIEDAGGDDGTRTRDLMRDRHAF